MSTNKEIIKQLGLDEVDHGFKHNNTVMIAEPGLIIGFGGTNARSADAWQDDIKNFDTTPTPTESKEFFDWMARKVLDASHKGQTWAVAGFPGPVTPDGKIIGPMANVSGLSNIQYRLTQKLRQSDPAISDILDDGFTLIAVNDGELAAHAVSSRISEYKHEKAAALIVGTGVGAGIVTLDKEYKNVSRADRTNPAEVGHLMLSDKPWDTFENTISGPAIKDRYGIDAKDLDPEHPAWREIGGYIGRLATTLSLINGVNIVVPTGGVGAGASEKFKKHLDAVMDLYAAQGNGAQKLHIPEIATIPSEDAQVFELYGAEGVLRDFITR